MLTPEFACLYDCGGENADAAGQKAAEHLLLAGVRRLDALVLSHYDEDHIGGFGQLLYRVDIDTLYLPRPAEGDADAASVLSLAAQRQVSVVYVDEVTEVPFPGGSMTLYPPISARNSNAESLSLLFSCADYAMLATGDLDELDEKMLLRFYRVPDVDLYIAGHHGSAHSSGRALLDAIRPETVLISVGYNRYGHPSAEALARFAELGAAVYRTDLCGDITIER